MTDKSILIVSIESGSSPACAIEHYNSISRQTHKNIVSMSINAELIKPGFLFNELSILWLQSDADYITYLPDTFRMPEDRITNQLAFMDDRNISASYVDLEKVTDQGEPVALVEIKDFSHKMIGIDCIPTEGLIINRKMFVDSGGLDYAFSGVYKPNVYLITMLGLAGKIEKCTNTRVHYTEDYGILDMYSKAIWNSDETRKMWERLNFDRFVTKAKSYYKGRY